MKTTSTNLYSLFRAIALLVVLGTTSVYAQAPFKGGSTYWINGNGTDIVAPKDTFANLMGAYVSGAYTTTTGIFNALTVNGVDPSTTGPINFVLVAGYNGIESTVISVGNATVGGYNFMSANRPIVLKPDAGIFDTITTTATVAANSSMFTFNGIQYFTIDGDNGAGRALTFRMPVASNSNLNRLIHFNGIGQNGCQSITVKNCILTGQSTTTAINTYAGFYVGGATTPSNPVKSARNISVQNNIIQAVQYGVYARGIGSTAQGGQDFGLSVMDNQIGGSIAPGGTVPTTFIGGSGLAAGILISAQANATISGNVIKNSLVGTTLGGFRGIALTTDAGTLALDSNCSISGNSIYNHSNTATTNTGTYGIRIALGTHNYPLNNLISNNTIGKLLTNNAGTTIAGFLYPIGILIEDNSANAGYNIYNNTINLSGDTLPNSSFSACMAFSGTVTGGVNAKNNIFANRMGRTVVSANGAPPSTYGVISMSTTFDPFASFSSNAFYVTNFTGTPAYLGYWNSKNRVSLREINNVFGGVNISRIPPFIGVNDSTMTLANGDATTLGSEGEAIPAVTKDILGVTRSATTPSIGAYEFAGNTAIANYALMGGTTYPINGVNAWPAGAGASGSFATVADAINYLNNYGATAAGEVRFEISAGYPKESSFIPAVIEYPGTNQFRSVTLTTASGYSDTLTVPNRTVGNHYSVLRLFGTRYFNLDGNFKSLTLLAPANITNNTFKMIALVPTDTTVIQDVTIKNTIITGQSSPSVINTFAGIYHGYAVPTGAGAAASTSIGMNNNITISGNLIQAVRNGIYVRGANLAGVQNRNWTISGNTIGGITPNGGALNTTYIGGNSTVADEQGGIILKSIVMSTITNNTIRNSIPVAASSSFKGIDINYLNELNGKDSALTISRNIIYNMNASSAANTFAYGIRINLGTDSLRAITIVNNSIAKIIGAGSGTNNSTSNPMAIYVDAPGTVNNLGLSIYFNSIQMGGAVLANGSSSSCVFLNTSISGGVSIHGNILSNTMGRLSGATGNTYGIFIGSGNSAGNGPLRAPTGTSNFNAYYAGAIGSVGYIGCSSNGAIGYNSLASWRAYTAADVGSYFIPPAFYNDTLPDLDPSLSGAIANGAAALPSVTTDLNNNPRGNTLTNIGALQFTQNFTPLAGGGTYQINGLQSPPTSANPNSGSFATINRAFQYINANGVDNFGSPVAPIKLIISNGYVGEGDTLISALLDYPRMNANRPITLTLDAGRNDTIRTTGVVGAYGINSSVIRIAGASYFTIDGSNNGGTSRDLTIALPSVATGSSVKVIDITAQNLPTTNVTIKNCNIVGNSTTAAINSYAGIYLGGVSATPSNVSLTGNNNNLIQNNRITSVRNGIYFQGLSGATTGAAGQQDVGNKIIKNIIGGDNNLGGTTPTDFFGGAANAAGIFLSAQSGATVDGNTISNNIKGFANNRGIELSNLSGQVSVDTNITISNNTISRIENTTAAGGAYGIYVSLGVTTNRAITMINNMVSRITAPGTNSTPAASLANAYGICVDAGGTNNNYGLTLYNNSVNLCSTSSISVTNGTSAALFLGAGIRGGVVSVNNIYQNTNVRTNGFGRIYAVLVGANLNVFSNSDYNNYFAAGANSDGYVMGTNATTNPVLWRTVDTLSTLTNMDTLSIGFVTPFTNDSNLFIPLGTPSPIFGSGKVLTQVPNDISGNPRSISQTVIGAHEYLGSYVDSIAPKAYNVTPPQLCGNGPFAITMRVIERNVASDTLYYSVNGGATLALVGPSVNGFNRTFTIPSQPANSSITYYYSVNDGSAFAFNAENPVDGYSYLSTLQSNFPMYYGFDLPNVQGWSVQQVTGVGGWNLDSYGSGNLPILGAKTGNKAALFPSATLAAGTTSRLISPCLDLTLMKMPTLRFWISQNADAPTNRDSITVKVSAIPGVWSSPLKNIYRVNASYSFPDYTMIEVCLSNYVGIAGLRVALEASAKGGGNNMVLDSIMIYDDIITPTITPMTLQNCLYDSVSLTLSNTMAGYTYQFVNALNNGTNYGPARLGNGGSVNVKATNQQLDSLYLQLKYTNNNSGCINLLTDQVKVYVKKFSNGPFLAKGTGYTANYNVGTQAQPDAGKFGDAFVYKFNPPSGLSNSDYGTTWTIVNNSVRTVSGTSASSSSFTGASAGNDAKYTITAGTNDGDSLYKMTATIRLLPSGCDSTVTRWMKVTSPPTVDYLASGSGTGCAKQQMTFTNLSTYAPSTAPVSNFWDFGDGSTATTNNATKTYDTAGTYTVTLKVTNNAGIMTQISKTITIKDAPTPNFTFGNVCAGSPVAMTNGTARGDAYSWTYKIGGSTEGTSSSVSPVYAFALGDTAYDVVMVATNSVTGCSNSITKQVYSFPKPTAAFSTTGHCLGTNVAIKNTSAVNTTKPNSSFGSEWEFGNGQKGLSNQPFYIYPASGTYSIKLKVTTNFGCTDSTTNLITVFDRPVPAFAVSNTCQYDQVTLANTTSFSGGLSKVTYNWDFGDNTNSQLSNPSKIYGVTGKISIKLVVQDTIHFCKDSLIRYAEVFNKPIAAFVSSQTKGCEGNEIVFTNASTVQLNQDSMYKWDFADGNTATTKNATHTYSTSNQFAVKLTVTTKNLCSDVAQKLINISSPPVISFTKSQPNTDDPCYNNYTWDFTPTPTTLSSYNWNFGDGTIANTTGATQRNVYNYKGKHVVTLVASDANGCTGTFTDTVTTLCDVGMANAIAENFNLNISPNPFTHATNVNYTLVDNAKVKITVYDMMGRTVASYDLGEVKTGKQQFELNADKFNGTSSTYMVRIDINDQSVSQKIIQAK